ncbi:hypothetical protein GCM10020358_69060 [Amorphoplanes nipponensis]|uniref:Uncharacterized protein n=1 Tax=Actinoplanes nipponensis TaxID=135950 RepID=A0A919JLW7_9ACTN|nr:hypothetical protein [Actinoplanes nipponensis]GIE53203.1 hypothetical protein Ani05nite_67370 [Actinoplanes nipponensis]
MSTLTRNTALCGHPECDPFQRRNSILDDEGDVVLYNDCTGVKYMFRDTVCHGLILGRGWTLIREGESEPAATLKHVADRAWTASWPSGRVFLRHDTGYGLIAKVARRLLKPAKCCHEDR